jgi:hypothetical protein
MNSAEEQRQAVAELASEPHLWWGHHAGHGWVVLDRQEARNQGGSRHLFRCRDWAALEVSRAEFGSDQFTWFKNHLASLPVGQVREACEQLLVFRRAFVQQPWVTRISSLARIRGADGTPLEEAAVRRFDGAASDCGLAACNADVAELGIRGGRVQLTYDPKAGHFRAVSEYEAPGRLEQPELDFLKDRTRGDWSDGVGGAFFEYLGDSRGVAVIVSQEGQLQVEQGPGRLSLYGQWTELAKACWRGDLEKARAALDAGEDVNTRADGLPVLQAAIAGGRGGVALLLIERGADLHCRDLLDVQRDALMSCVTSVRLADGSAALIAQALLQRGADAQAARNKGGDTPLDVARRRGRARLIEILEKHELGKSPSSPEPPLPRVKKAAEQQGEWV